MVKRIGLLASCVTLFCALAIPAGADPLNVSGFLGLESRSFPNTDQGPNVISSMVGEVRSIGPITDSLSYDLRLYGRGNVDGRDGGYFDPTVAKLTWQSGNWQLDAGYDLVFWGVAEGRNVVNVINQRDQIRDPFFDQGLGQSMLATRYFGRSVTLAGFILPRFRELKFGAEDRTWGLGLPVDDDASTFESDAGVNDVDYALRLSGFGGNLEYGVFAFDGTLRQPEFRLDATATNLIPHYREGQQVGVDAQYTSGAFLYKFEGVGTRPDSNDDYWSTIVGVEYVMSDFLGQPWATSLFAEYYRDSRQDDPSVLFQNDVFVSAQIRLQNTLATEIEIGAILDPEHEGVIGTANLSSRITDNLSFEAEYIHYDASDPNDALFTARNSDQAFVRLQWSF